jgi:hypothetical protein
MIYNPQSSCQYLITELDERAIKYTVHEFNSGAKMVDMWYNELFYVIQIESDFIGVSLIDDNNIAFDTTPDVKFFANEEFVAKLMDIFNQR